MSQADPDRMAHRAVRLVAEQGVAGDHAGAVHAFGPFASWRAALPAQGYVCVLACLLLFAGYLAYGANTGVGALTFAALWLALGGFSLILARPGDMPPLSAALIVAGVAFVGALVVVATQLLDAGEGMAHPVWSYVDAPAAFTIDRDATLRELIKLVSLAGAFAVGFLVGGSDRRTRFLVFITIAGTILYSGWAFLQHFQDAGALFGMPKPYHVDRLTASFLSANSAATVFGIMALIAAGRLARAVKESASPEGVLSAWGELLTRKGALAAAALLLAVVCLVETGSRFGLAVTAGLLVVFTAWEVRVASEGLTARRATTAALVVGGLIAFAALGAGGGAVERIGEAAEDAGSRFEVFRVHFGLFLEQPWRGYGLGSFPALNQIALTPDNLAALGEINAAHNVYLQWLEEAGVAGASLMFGCLALILLHIWRGLSQRASMRTWIRASLLMSALVLLHGTLDYALQVPAIAWQWALWLGVGAGLAAPRAREVGTTARDFGS